MHIEVEIIVWKFLTNFPNLDRQAEKECIKGYEIMKDERC